MKRPATQILVGIAFGAGLGAAVAVLLGTGGLWLAAGVAVGIVIGISMSRKNLNDKRLTTND